MYGFSGWGQYLAVLPDKVTNISSTAKSLSLLSVLICFGFFSAGFVKTVHWINFDLNISGTAKWFYSQFYSIEREQLLLAPYIKYLPFWTFKIMDFIAVSFELSPLLFLLLGRKAWRVWILIACVFHMFNTLMLNINFIFTSIAYLCFADFTPWFKKIKYLSALKSVKSVICSSLALIIIVRVYYSFNLIFATNIFFPEYSVEMNLYFALLIWNIIIILLFKSTFRKTAASINNNFNVNKIALSSSIQEVKAE